ncbi:unnamed protein product [Amoebophrya sp. A120]|nr:unnamed protein product [Amoebophrya sp. A120]|eukprot:GSA120T00024814001.1
MGGRSKTGADNVVRGPTGVKMPVRAADDIRDRNALHGGTTATQISMAMRKNITTQLPSYDPVNDKYLLLVFSETVTEEIFVKEEAEQQAQRTVDTEDDEREDVGAGTPTSSDEDQLHSRSRFRPKGETKSSAAHVYICATDARIQEGLWVTQSDVLKRTQAATSSSQVLQATNRQQPRTSRSKRTSQNTAANLQIGGTSGSSSAPKVPVRYHKEILFEVGMARGKLLRTKVEHRILLPISAAVGHVYLFVHDVKASEAGAGPGAGTTRSTVADGAGRGDGREEDRRAAFYRDRNRISQWSPISFFIVQNFDDFGGDSNAVLARPGSLYSELIELLASKMQTSPGANFHHMLNKTTLGDNEQQRKEPFQMGSYKQHQHPLLFPPAQEQENTAESVNNTKKPLFNVPAIRLVFEKNLDSFSKNQDKLEHDRALPKSFFYLGSVQNISYRLFYHSVEQGLHSKCLILRGSEALPQFLQQKYPVAVLWKEIKDSEQQALQSGIYRMIEDLYASWRRIVEEGEENNSPEDLVTHQFRQRLSQQKFLALQASSTQKQRQSQTGMKTRQSRKTRASAAEQQAQAAVLQGTKTGTKLGTTVNRTDSTDSTYMGPIIPLGKGSSSDGDEPSESLSDDEEHHDEDSEDLNDGIKTTALETDNKQLVERVIRRQSRHGLLRQLTSLSLQHGSNRDLLYSRSMVLRDSARSGSIREKQAEKQKAEALFSRSHPSASGTTSGSLSFAAHHQVVHVPGQPAPLPVFQTPVLSPRLEIFRHDYTDKDFRVSSEMPDSLDSDLLEDMQSVLKNKGEIGEQDSTDKKQPQAEGAAFESAGEGDNVIMEGEDDDARTTGEPVGTSTARTAGGMQQNRRRRRVSWSQNLEENEKILAEIAADEQKALASTSPVQPSEIGDAAAGASAAREDLHRNAETARKVLLELVQSIGDFYEELDEDDDAPVSFQPGDRTSSKEKKKKKQKPLHPADLDTDKLDTELKYELLTLFRRTKQVQIEQNSTHSSWINVPDGAAAEAIVLECLEAKLDYSNKGKTEGELKISVKEQLAVCKLLVLSLRQKFGFTRLDLGKILEKFKRTKMKNLREELLPENKPRSTVRRQKQQEDRQSEGAVVQPSVGEEQEHLPEDAAAEEPPSAPEPEQLDTEQQRLLDRTHDDDHITHASSVTAKRTKNKNINTRTGPFEAEPEQDAEQKKREKSKRAMHRLIHDKFETKPEFSSIKRYSEEVLGVSDKKSSENNNPDLAAKVLVSLAKLDDPKFVERYNQSLVKQSLRELEHHEVHWEEHEVNRIQKRDNTAILKQVLAMEKDLELLADMSSTVSTDAMMSMLNSAPSAYKSIR